MGRFYACVTSDAIRVVSHLYVFFGRKAQITWHFCNIRQLMYVNFLGRARFELHPKSKMAFLSFANAI